MRSLRHPILLILMAVKFVACLEVPCGGRPADIVFALDMSYSIWPPDFEKQIKFVQSIVELFPIDEQIMRVGVYTFSLEVRPWINLGDYTDKEGLKEAIGQIQQVQTGGYHTYTDRALNYMRKQQLNKAREGVTKLGIVITDGLSHRQGDTAVEAALTRNDGIHVFAIGVGSLADKDELINIASLPSDDYMFQVDSYGALSRIREILAIKACTVTDPPTEPPPTTTTTPHPTTTTPYMMRTPYIATTLPTKEIKFRAPITVGAEALEKPTQPPPNAELRGRDDKDRNRTPKGKGNDCRDPMDLVFIVDSKTGSKADQRKIWKHIHEIIANLDQRQANLRLKFIYECASVPGLNLGVINEKDELQTYFQGSKGASRRTADLLRSATLHLTNANRTEDGVKRRPITVYITDGESGKLESTLREAQDAKLNHEIQIFGIGIGPKTNPVEMNALVSCDPRHHLMSVPSASKLRRSKARTMTKRLCKARPKFS